METPDRLIPLILAVGTTATIWTALGRRTSRVEARLEKRIERTEKRTGSRLERMEGRLIDAIRSLAPGGAVAKRVSPVVLTDLGKTISVSLNAEEWAGKLAASLMDAAGEQDYEIQDFAFEYVEDMYFTDEQQGQIRQAAYEHGLSGYSVRRVLAIELRDALLALRKEADAP